MYCMFLSSFSSYLMRKVLSFKSKKRNIKKLVFNYGSNYRWRQSVWWNLKLLCKHCLRDVYTYVRLPSCRWGRRQYLGCRILNPFKKMPCFFHNNDLLICSEKFEVKCKNWKWERGFLFCQLLIFILWAFQTIFG